MTGLLDGALDALVAPGYSRVGFAARRLGRLTGPGSLDGQIALVTGGNSGIGEAVCHGLLDAGAEVHLLGRNRERVEGAVQRLEARVPAASERLVPELCNLADAASIREFAASFLSRRSRLNVLVSNAGVMPQKRHRTSDGLELTFATNVLGPFLLTRLLLPSLRAAAPARVITVSSGGMYTARLDAGDAQLDAREFDGARFYAHTKRAQVVLSRLWSERHPAGQIAFNAMHPGWVQTPGLRSSMPRFERLLRPVLRTPEQGADTAVWLATEARLEPATGGFWHDRHARPEHRVPWTRESSTDRIRLWDACEQLLDGVATPEGARPSEAKTEAADGVI